MAGSSELAELGRGEIRPEMVELLCRLRGEPAMTTEEIAELTGVPVLIVEEQLENATSEMLESRADRTGGRWWYPDPTPSG